MMASINLVRDNVSKRARNACLIMLDSEIERRRGITPALMGQYIPQSRVDTTSQWDNDAGLVQVPGGALTLEGSLSMPEPPGGFVLCAYASQNDQHKVREGYVKIAQ